MAARGLFSLPSDDLIRTAALVATNEDPDYPVTNVQDDDPSNTFKATGTSSVITATVTSSTPVAFAFVNTNMAAGALTNGGALVSQAQTVPSRTVDGKQRNGWKNITGVAARTSTTFIFTISKTGSAPLEIGKILLLAAIRDVLWLPKVNYSLKRPGSVRNTTRLGAISRRLSPVAAPRIAAGKVNRASELATLLDLEASSNGLGYGFFLVPDRDENDAWFCMPTEDAAKWMRENSTIAEIEFAAQELSMGLPPALT